MYLPIPLFCNISNNFFILSSRASKVCFCVSILNSSSYIKRETKKKKQKNKKLRQFFKSRVVSLVRKREQCTFYRKILKNKFSSFSCLCGCECASVFLPLSFHVKLLLLGLNARFRRLTPPFACDCQKQILDYVVEALLRVDEPS